VVEADPGALRRVLESLEEHGVVPLRVVAQRASLRGRTDKRILEIEIDIPRADLAPAILGVISPKLEYSPLIRRCATCSFEDTRQAVLR